MIHIYEDWKIKSSNWNNGESQAISVKLFGNTVILESYHYTKDLDMLS
jgi:hypothetical protein